MTLAGSQSNWEAKIAPVSPAIFHGLFKKDVALAAGGGRGAASLWRTLRGAASSYLRRTARTKMEIAEDIKAPQLFSDKRRMTSLTAGTLKVC